MVEAAAAVVAERGFESTSIREICARAGVSSGAFYARFARKEDLALPLFESLRGEFEAIVDASLERRRVAGFAESIRVLLGGAVALYRRNAGLLRALTAQARTSRDLAAAMRELNETLFARLLEPPFVAEIRHPKPEIALRLGLLCVLNATKEIVLDQQLFRESYPFRDEELVAELTSLLSRYVSPTDA